MGNMQSFCSSRPLLNENHTDIKKNLHGDEGEIETDV